KAIPASRLSGDSSSVMWLDSHKGQGTGRPTRASARRRSRKGGDPRGRSAEVGSWSLPGSSPAALGFRAPPETPLNARAVLLRETRYAVNRALRAEKGAGKVEYGALVLMVATLVVALVAFNLPADVRRLYEVGLCRITGDEDCGEPGSGGEQAGGGEGGSGGSGSDTEGGGSDGGEEEDDGGPEDSEEPSDDTDTIVYDPGAAQALLDAHKELADAKKAKEDAESEYAGLDKELMKELLDLMGVEDARKCLTEGDIVACLSTIVGFTPWGKGLKAIKKAPKIAKLFSRWRKLKKAKDASLKRLN